MTKHGIIRKLLIILFWLAVWALAAAGVNTPLLLPDPVSVFVRIFTLAGTSAFWNITALSLLRITAGIVFATVLGVMLALVTTASPFLRELLSPILTVIKVTPVASFIILVLIWLSRDFVPAVISAMMVLPVVWNNVSTGLRNMDRSLLEMAAMYRVPKLTRAKRIVIPSVMPYFLSAVQTSIGIGWKAGIAAEVLTVPMLSIGKMIYESKLYLETLDLFAWTVVVVCISLLLEVALTSGIRKMGRKYNSEEAAQ